MCEAVQAGHEGEKALRGHTGGDYHDHFQEFDLQQARKPRSSTSPKLRPTNRLTGVERRATSVAKNQFYRAMYTMILGISGFMNFRASLTFQGVKLG